MGKAKDGSECFTRTGKGGGKYVTCKGTQKGGAKQKADSARKELRKKVPEKKTVTKAQFENARRKLAGGTATGKSKKPAPKKKLGVRIEKPKEVNMKKEIPKSMMTVYERYNEDLDGERYYLKLRNKALTFADFGKWVRSGKSLSKDNREILKKTFDDVSKQGFKLYFALDETVFTKSQVDKKTIPRSSLTNKDLKVVALKNGKIGKVKLPTGRGDAEPLSRMDFDNTGIGVSGKNYQKVFFKESDVGNMF